MVGVTRFCTYPSIKSAGAVAAILAVKVEDTARAIGGASRGVEFADFDPGHDAVVVPDPTDLL
jgi:uncharacterized protein with NRDE domain